MKSKSADQWRVGWTILACSSGLGTGAVIVWFAGELWKGM